MYIRMFYVQKQSTYRNGAIAASYMYHCMYRIMGSKGSKQ